MKYIFIFLFLITFSSCGKIIYAGYGVKKLKSLSEEDKNKTLDKWNVTEGFRSSLDTNYLIELQQLKNDSSLHKKLKNHFQPLQAIYFDKNGYPKSMHVNCYAGGWPNLKWNKNGNFDVFPPKQQAPLDTLFTFEELIGYSESKPAIISDSSEYKVIIIWNRFMGRQSKRLIRYVNRNITLSPTRVSVYYLNNDNLYEFSSVQVPD